MKQREISTTSRKILEAIAGGKSYDQILSSQLATSYLDIFYAAAEALDVIDESATQESYVERMSKIRQFYPRAYENWLPEEDDKLSCLFRGGTNVNEIAAKLQRQPGAIRSRLTKLGLTS
jgi:hypothetical protein